MPCLIALLAFFLPRLTLFFLYLFSDHLSRAFQTTLWPLIGFFFMPYTTLAYAFAINSNGSVSGIYLVLVVVAVLCDLGALGGGESARRRRGRRPAAS